MIEYNNWYSPGVPLTRCLNCGALVSGADTDTHTDWHERIEAMITREESTDAADLSGQAR